MRYCSVCLANALLKNKLYNPHEHNDHLTSEERKFYAGERVRVCESVRDIVTTIYS